MEFSGSESKDILRLSGFEAFLALDLVSLEHFYRNQTLDTNKQPWLDSVRMP